GQISIEHRLPDRVPTVQALRGGAPACPEVALQLRVAQYTKYGVRKLSRAISNQDIVAIHGRETFASHRRADDRFPHRPRVEDLQPRAATSAQRNDAPGGGGDGRGR